MTTSHPHLVWVNSERLVRSRDMSEVAELVRAAAEGDQAAWNGLVDRYNGLVWSVARSHRLAMADASDVVQTTWLRLVEHLGRLQDPERVGAWLATTARREALRALRHSARQVPTAEAELRAIFGHMDPVPQLLSDGARAAFTWRTVDAELAELMRDSAEAEEEAGSLVRGGHGPRQLSFESPRLGIELEVTATGP